MEHEPDTAEAMHGPVRAPWPRERTQGMPAFSLLPGRKRSRERTAIVPAACIARCEDAGVPMANGTGRDTSNEPPPVLYEPPLARIDDVSHTLPRRGAIGGRTSLNAIASPIRQRPGGAAANTVMPYFPALRGTFDSILGLHARKCGLAAAWREASALNSSDHGPGLSGMQQLLPPNLCCADLA